MSDDSMRINLKAPVFSGFIVKFQAFLVTKRCAEVIQTNFKSKLPTMEDEKIDASTKLVKVKKLAKMKNVMATAYATQCLSSTTMLNVIFIIQAEAGWSSGRAHQLFDNLKHKYNPNYKLSRAQIKPMKGEDSKVMCDKI